MKNLELVFGVLQVKTQSWAGTCRNGGGRGAAPSAAAAPPASPASTQTSPDCLPSPPPSFCFPSRHPRLPTAVFPVIRAPAPTPAGRGRPTTRGVRTPPRRKWWRPREEEERPLVRREEKRSGAPPRPGLLTPAPAPSLPPALARPPGRRPARGAWTWCPADAPPARAGRGSRRRHPAPPVRSPRRVLPPGHRRCEMAGAPRGRAFQKRPKRCKTQGLFQENFARSPAVVAVAVLPAPCPQESPGGSRSRPKPPHKAGSARAGCWQGSSWYSRAHRKLFPGV